MNSLNQIAKTLEKDIEMKFKVIFVVRSAGTYCDPASQVLAEFESDKEADIAIEEFLTKCQLGRCHRVSAIKLYKNEGITNESDH